ncbi:MAG TPA: protein translocase subunit SecF [Desulfobacteraceae bacterium]|nr:protein translocase subunit SecF [Deltaproteobacteria bacterium]RLB25286.1 MAG: protein translocase subunit SecF [Deltaproteobacteria bacterium]HDH86838.1 protein translocase subunit SecF [Desulfobacteraceae bacterium]
MQFIKPDININFIGQRKIALFLSGALILLTILLLLFRGGPNYGVDFAGGILIQVRFNHQVTPGEIREALRPIGMEDSIIQAFGEKGKSEYLIRVSKTNIDLSGLSNEVKQSLNSMFGETNVEVRRVEMVGPKVGKDLREKALFAIFYAILFMVIYISGRFEYKWTMSIIMAASLAFGVYIISAIGMSIIWLIAAALLITIGLCWSLRLEYALGAIVALFHDVIITMGAFALTNREITLSIVAALLTIVGYSLNDTIVVFDRIRENYRRQRNRDFAEVINHSINETLSRTLLTSMTTLIVVVFLFILGGGVIHDFAFALLVGILVGTYSSIYVASPVLLIWAGQVSGGGDARTHRRRKGS